MDILQPKGPITGSVFGLCRLVAESTAFQRRAQAPDWHTALAHVHRWVFREHPLLVQAARPFAAIWPATMLDLEKFAGGVVNKLRSSGALVLVLTDIDRVGYDQRQDSGDHFAGWVDQVLNDIKGRAGRDDRLPITHISVLEPIGHSRDWDDEATGAFWEVMFLVEWQ